MTQMHRQADYNADIFYEYDANGKRIVKRYEDVIYYENGSGTLSAIRYPVTTYYSYCDDTLAYILIHDDSSRDSGSYRELYFTYDAVGPLSVNYNGTEYFYLKNAQGDVTGIVNAAGTQVVAYTYDAWGKLLSTTGSMAGTLGEYNPLRYRGYVYDTETGLYYLNSRYYNPETGRFINADSYASTGQGIVGNNMFAYCENNPVLYSDYSGESIVGAFLAQLAIAALAAVESALITTVILPQFRKNLTEVVTDIYNDVRDVVSSTANSIKEKIEQSFARAKAAPNYKKESEIHHIVAQNDPRAKPAQEILTEVGINRFNDPVNLVPLKTGLHRRLHNDLYYHYVNFEIVSAYNAAGGNPVLARENVYRKLNQISMMLQVWDAVVPY